MTRAKTSKPKPAPSAVEREGLYLRGVPVEVLRALDAMADDLSAERGSRVTRSDVVRESLARVTREYAAPKRVEPDASASKRTAA